MKHLAQQLKDIKKAIDSEHIKMVEGIPNRMHEIRERENLSQEEVAEIIGMSQTAYSKLERGIFMTSMDKLLLFMAATNTSPNEFFGWE